ncbi:dihydroorotate dehydrogenase electron transfer subunit [Luteitalea sp.]|jgi:dihydroorotate dehydrogenase electron transfer subunit|uniref:dihydroorotate dehydrogenase electron transfer subunit n=1 Tax=Luteitalea sp. TaxID=2004800 RepID=UPI0037CAA9BC
MLPGMIVDVQADVLGNRALSAEYNVVTLAAPAIAAAARPGQFVMVKTKPGLEPLLRRPFSIFEIVRGADGTPLGISILNKRIGIGTGQLFDAREGDRLGVLGPLGQPWPLVEAPTRAWMVAGGVGLAPFATLTEALSAQGVPLTLFYGARRGEDLYYAEWFAERGVDLVLATEDGSRGTHGRITLPLEAALRDTAAEAPVAIYCCGPTPMMQAVAERAAAAGREAWVSLEQVMGCGMGGCYSCVVPVKTADGGSHFVRSCTNGPVFAASTLQWEGLAHHG